MVVPSPTYLLQNVYDDAEGVSQEGSRAAAHRVRMSGVTRFKSWHRHIGINDRKICFSSAGPEIHHFDLYRLAATETGGRLNLIDSFSNAVSLIEWADRLKSVMPSQCLNVQFSSVSKVRTNTICHLIFSFS